MKKILLAFDGSNFSAGAFAFVRHLNEMQPVLVTALFVPQVDFANLWSYSTASAGSVGVYIPLLETDATNLIAENIKNFESLCQQNNIAYRVHKDFVDFALPELKKESRFADVMVVSGEMFYKRFAESDHLDYLRDLLHVSECPVLVVPEQYSYPDNNIIAYDGSEESVYAIKQFAYIFPELANNQTLLIYAEQKKEAGFPSKDYIVELATQHYKSLTFYKLEMNPKKYFSAWLADRKGSVLISGSFSRTAISQLIKKSFVFDIIREHNVPVFIAHK